MRLSSQHGITAYTAARFTLCSGSCCNYVAVHKVRADCAVCPSTDGSLVFEAAKLTDWLSDSVLSAVAAHPTVQVWALAPLPARPPTVWTGRCLPAPAARPWVTLSMEKPQPAARHSTGQPMAITPGRQRRRRQVGCFLVRSNNRTISRMSNEFWYF